VSRDGAAGPDGLVVVDKPAGWTSHDVVARVRRILGTRKVGHAGTLDPMATGVLVLGVGRATRLLGHLALTDKTYEATIRLGATTTTDDAEGEVLAAAPEAVRAADVGTDRVVAAMAALTGVIEQVPASVSAVKVGGVRAYARVRAGEQVQLTARRVTVSEFTLLARRDGATGRPDDAGDDVDVLVACSSGTYVRALARDLGAALGCGGHLVALRRTSAGPFAVSAALGLDELAVAGASGLIGLADAVAAGFPRRDVDADQARDVAFGRPLPAAGIAGVYGVFGPDGAVLALAADDGRHSEAGRARYLVVFAPHRDTGDRRDAGPRQDRPSRHDEAGFHRAR
jgi:tRNA pseudouridine55 synthase